MSKNSQKYNLEEALRGKEDEQLCLESYPYDEGPRIGFEFHIFFDITRCERSGDINTIEFSHARIIDGREESPAILTFTQDTEEEFVDAAWLSLRGGA
tara:strand:+ start:1316 stop:1609 length:294 start_codon:yes stop_codon:yes gene_type:complete